MALQGTIVGAPIVPGDSDQDVFPTHIDWLGKGGWRPVATTAVRDAITAERRSVGMRVYVIEENKTYKLAGGLTNANWELCSEIISAANSPVPTSEVWKGTQAQFQAIYAAGLNPNILYLFIKEKQVVRDAVAVQSFILTMWDHETDQLVLTACNFQIDMIVGKFDCTIVIAENVAVTVFAGTSSLSRMVGGTKTIGNQVLAPGCYRIIRKGTTSEFKIC